MMGCYRICFTCEHLDTGRGKMEHGLESYRCKRWSKWTRPTFCCESHEFKGQSESLKKVAKALKEADGNG